LTSVEETQNFTADLFASCFFVVKNSIGSSQYDDPEQTRRKKTANPVFDIRVREIITGAYDTALIDASIQLYDDLSRSMIVDVSKVVIKFLQVMQKHGYINEFEHIDDHRSGKIVVELNGRINKCGVISPRYDLSHTDVEDWVGRLLPSRLFGVIVLTTANGILDHEEARRKKVGGKVLGFFY
jgi:small subunit ribosomal protein S15Ae